jgi:hypothetical protein
MSNLDEIDKQIATWESSLATAVSNLHDLEKLLSYRILVNVQTQASRLTGQTKEKAQPVITNLLEIWAHLGLLQNVLEKAKQKRHLKKRPDQATLDEIDRLLNGDSIEFPALVVPLKQRGLLGRATTTTTCTPTLLLSNIAAVFAEASDVLSDINDAWKNLQPKLDKIRKEARALSSEAIQLGQTTPKAILDLEALLDKWQEVLSSDPLSVAKDLEENAQTLLETGRKTLIPLRQAKEELEKNLIQAMVQLLELEALGKACSEHHLEMLDAIDNPPSFERSDIRHERLKQWFDKISEEAKNNFLTAAQKFSNWQIKAQEFRRLESLALAGYQSALEERNELKTRLRMYRTSASKQKYDGKNMLEDQELLALGAKADNELARPANLAAARQFVDEYHNRLRSLERWNKDGTAST